MAYQFAYQEDEPKEPFQDDSMFQGLLARGKAKSTPVSEILMEKFRRSVQSVLDVEVGPALEMPAESKEVA